ncbi:MAG: glycosyltransferase, partial [Lachnospiraceae bacterium]|nr:glycosyltransferase [Lachnospiraceae bacterium]
MDKITIIVPCYNEHESIPFLIPELEKVMESMKEEACFEVLMINNCSEDNTLDLMKEIHEKDARFQY